MKEQTPIKPKITIKKKKKLCCFFDDDQEEGKHSSMQNLQTMEWDTKKTEPIKIKRKK